MIWCILIPLLVGLISAFLGYFLGRARGGNTVTNNEEELRLKISNLETQLKTNKSESVNNSLASNNAQYEWKKKFVTLEADFESYKKTRELLERDLEDCKKSHKALEKNLKSLKSTNDSGDDFLKKKISSLRDDLENCKKSKETLQASLDVARNISFLASTDKAGIAFDADAAKAVFGKKIKQDDLTIIEGIGPKIQELFHKNGVKTWKALSECSVEKCQDVLDSGGDRFRIHSPNTWPKQALLAYKGSWQKLFDWQEDLDGGKIV